MEKRLVAVMVLFIIVLALSGCFPTEKRVDEDTSSTSFESTHLDDPHFEYSKDNLSVSFDIPETPDELPSRIKLREKIFDRQQVIELFFGGEAIVSEYLYGANEEYGQYTAQDGSELTVEGNLISYYNGKFLSREREFPVSYFYVINACKEYMRDMYSITENELDEFPLQTALKTANDLISELGITGCGDPEIYAVSLTSYEKIYSDDARIFNKNGPLTKDNEIYVFKFPQVIGEVDLSDLLGVEIKDSTREWDTLANSSSIIVGVSREGIFEFNIDAAYETDVEILSTEPIKYDLSHAVTELEKYFDKVYFTKAKTVAINNARVFYFPVEKNEADTVEFVPAWSFEGYSRDLVYEEKIGHVALWDFRFIVNTDVGVVREYSEV